MREEENTRNCNFLKNNCRKIWWNKIKALPLQPHLRNDACDSVMESDKEGWVSG